MKRLFLSAALCSLLVPAAQARNGNGNVSISVEDDEQLTSCDQVVVRFDHSKGYRAEENLPVSGMRSLKLRAAQNGGIYVTGGSGYSIKACKAAELESTLRDMRLNVSGSEVTADAPDGGNWVIYFLVTVPRSATADLESNNGPISLRGVSGSITARATNGPISVRNSSGSMDLTTQNGPISLAGGSGEVKLNAQNGPISVKLDDSIWNGTLDARTQNGPLSVKLPRNFRSGTLIESAGHGPMSCHAEACTGARRSWDEDDERPRKIEFGSGPMVVHMTTVNGPVSVKEAD